MPIAEHSVLPRPAPNPVPVARGFPSPAPNPATVIVADAYGNNTVTNPNSSDPPVTPKNLPKAKPSILGTLRSLLSDPRTYGAAVILADALFNSGLGTDRLVTVLPLLMAAIKLTIEGPCYQDSNRQSDTRRL